jgi:hypothetical protein
MFNINHFIDTVQASNKMFVDTFVTVPEAKSTLNAIVEAQTSFVKQLFKSGETFTEYFKKV